MNPDELDRARNTLRQARATSDVYKRIELVTSMTRKEVKSYFAVANDPTTLPYSFWTINKLPHPLANLIVTLDVLEFVQKQRNELREWGLTECVVETFDSINPDILIGVWMSVKGLPFDRAKVRGELS